MRRRGSMLAVATAALAAALATPVPPATAQETAPATIRETVPAGIPEITSGTPPGTVQDAALVLGKQVFDAWCGICHGLPSGASGGGTETLAALYQGTDIPAQLEDRSDLTAELVITLTREGRNTMPNFRKTEISDVELQALVGYLVGDGSE